MANQYGLFWNSVSGDRTYNADSFAEWANTFFSTGVFNGDLQVTPDSGMVVNVGTGYANINGKVRLFDAQTTFTLSPASGTYPRIDTIVVRRNDTARTITLEYVTGAYSGLDPQPTAPTRDETTYEIVLAQILVNAGATSISAADITDTRADATICGWITGSVDSVDVDQLTEQARAQFDEWFQEMKDQLSEDAAGHLQAEIDTLNNGKTDYIQIADSTDLDTLVKSGVYKSPNSNSKVGTLTNCPVSTPFTMLVTGSGTNTTGCVQTVFGEGQIYVRRGVTSGFGSWVSFAKQDDLMNVEILSYDERKVGTWVDGKPLYRKTIYRSSLPNSTATNYQHGIANVDTIFLDNTHSFVRWSSGSTAPLPYISTSYSSAVDVNSVSSTTYTVNTHGTDRRALSGYFTFLYTKTTD